MVRGGDLNLRLFRETKNSWRFGVAQCSKESSDSYFLFKQAEERSDVLSPSARKTSPKPTVELYISSPRLRTDKF